MQMSLSLKRRGTTGGKGAGDNAAITFSDRDETGGGKVSEVF